MRNRINNFVTSWIDTSRNIILSNVCLAFFSWRVASNYNTKFIIRCVSYLPLLYFIQNLIHVWAAMEVSSIRNCDLPETTRKLETERRTDPRCLMIRNYLTFVALRYCGRKYLSALTKSPELLGKGRGWGSAAVIKRYVLGFVSISPDYSPTHAGRGRPWLRLFYVISMIFFIKIWK